DQITDFTHGVDRIVFDRAVFTGIAASGGLSAAAFHVGGAAADAGDRIIYNAGTGQLFYDADGFGGVDQVLIARLGTGLALTNTDFIGYI
ncbi:MAG TPA: hypothetical protein VGX37_07300, partial [Allosphingosinicella sp.]|nr:hypothetical protein [Allosphingosinicella sp.]